MSLRLLAGLLVALAAMMVPATSLMLLRWFPPPDVITESGECSTDPAQPGLTRCVHFEGPGERGFVQHLSLAGPEPGLLGAMPFQFPLGPESRPAGTGILHGNAGEMPPPIPPVTLSLEMRDNVRRHFLLINTASLLVAALAAALVFSLVLRRPVRGLLSAIGDVERGATPPEWAFSGPTELRVVGRALARLGRQLRSNLQERELMLAGLSHDLRSPLARIRAAVELHGGGESRWNETLRDVDDINHIVGQCIDYARDGQDEVLEMRPLDEIVHAARLGAPEQVSIHCAAADPVPVRPLSLVRALRNLVDNARLHGQPPVRVSTGLRDDHAFIAVTDTGPGISAGAWERLRRPFARGSQARTGSGCGLGLAIAQRVADQHGGSLELLQTESAQGCTIELRLPRKQAISKSLQSVSD